MNKVYTAALVIFVVTIGCAVAPYFPPPQDEDSAEVRAKAQDYLLEPEFGTTPAGGGGNGGGNDEGNSSGGSGGAGDGDEGGDGDGDGPS